MKKLLIVLFTGLIAASTLSAQYSVAWTNLNLIDPANDYTRDAVYNRNTDHVLVATRKYSEPQVVILDAASGDSLGLMDNTGIEGGTYALNLIDIDDDGAIYICNLSAPQYTPNSTLKIYRYTDESATPVLIFDDALGGGRFGDSFATIGSGSDVYLYTSGQGNDQLAVITYDGGANATLDSYITLPEAGAARHGISPMEPGGRLWINGADEALPAPRLIASDGTVIATVPDSLASAGGTSTITHNTLGEYKIITVANAFSSSIRSVRYFEDEIGTVTFDYFGDNSDSLALAYNGVIKPNANGTAALSYDSRRNRMITIIGQNSLASLSLEPLLKTSTPRDSVLTVSIDGSNDFFPTDHVGLSNGRDMYLTWSEGKVFFGVTGHTLVDATETNYLYVAFDLDPDGSNGTMTPPTGIGENAGGVAQLPFNADVVYEVEPWEAADYMIGTIYKWNGSEWTEGLFDGNFASQGALAYADEGDRKLAEVAAIENDPGIGTDFTNLSMMVYMAEKTSSGNVLSAFPDNNPTGNGVSFTHYFYVDSLGRGMFPTDTNYVHIKQTEGTGVGSENPGIIEQVALTQNYPNPFNPMTTINYSLPRDVKVQLNLYNVRGQLLSTLINSKQYQGMHHYEFDGSDYSSGIYFYRLNVDGQTTEMHKMVLLK